MTGPLHRTRRRLIAAARRWGALGMLLLALGGCAAPGGGAGAHNDVGRCASVLELARSAVPGGGTPVIIRPVTREEINTLVDAADAQPHRHATSPPAPPGPKPAPPTNAAGQPIPRWCLVVIPGRFAPGSVAGAVPTDAAGDHVLVVAQTRPAQVDHLVVTQGIPSAASPPPWWKFW